MDNATIEALRRLDEEFYRAHHESFSASRGSAWPGWERVAGHLAPGKLLDVACGNLRFERFLRERRGASAFEFTCLDSCGELAADRDGITFTECDVIDLLVKGEALPGGFDSAVSFGFMHHVPSRELREKLLRALVESVRSGGTVAVSFWRFMRDERLVEKARRTTAEALGALDVNLEEGDYLLGWNDLPGAYRYCHHFDDDEIDALAQGLDVLDRFDADGRTGALNTYLVLRPL